MSDHGQGALPPRYFRAGVGAVIFNTRGQVLVLERTDVPGAWQFPQGGLDPGETPGAAARREAEEETGIPRRSLRLLGRYPDLLAYELPAKARSARTGLGQVQYWFYFETRDATRPLTRLPPGEFRAARWVSFARAVADTAPFRAPLYAKLQRYARVVRGGGARPATAPAGRRSSRMPARARAEASEDRAR